MNRVPPPAAGVRRGRVHLRPPDGAGAGRDSADRAGAGAAGAGAAGAGAGIVVPPDDGAGGVAGRGAGVTGAMGGRIRFIPVTLTGPGVEGCAGAAGPVYAAIGT